MLRRLLITFSLLLGADLAVAAGMPPAQLSADQEITLLISLVENSGCHFHRNGSRYTSTQGAAHLRLKFRRGAKYARTTESFIKNLATKSSWSGKPYKVELTDGSREPLADWLTRELRQIRLAGAPE